MTVIEFKRKLGQPLDADDHEVIDDLDQMSEDAEREESKEWRPPAPADAAPRDEPQSRLRPVDGARRASA
jgi:hypothetical protein